MKEKYCKIHLDLNQGTIDVEGSEEFVIEHFENLKKVLLDSKGIEEKPRTKTKTSARASRRALIKKEIDLKASGDVPSLLEFYDKARRPTFLARSILFLYYLKNLKKHEKITTAYIKTCYDAVKASPPSNIYQNVIVGGGKKNWVDVSDTKDLELTPTGMEEVEKVLLVPEKRATRKKEQPPNQKKKTRTRKKAASPKKVSRRRSTAKKGTLSEEKSAAPAV